MSREYRNLITRALDAAQRAQAARLKGDEELAQELRAQSEALYAEAEELNDAE